MNTEFKRITACAAAMGALSVLGAASAQAECAPAYSYMGDICITAADYCPEGTLRAVGQLLPISQNQQLFALLGTAYGGDGKTTFAIPNLQGRMPVGTGPIATDQSDNGMGRNTITRGTKRGMEQYDPSIQTMATHSHFAEVLTMGAVRANSAPERDGSASSEGPGPESEPTTPPFTVTLDPAGSSSTVYTVPPELGVNFCIVAGGGALYPPRN